MRIHHVAFRTADLPRLERFYAEVLGLAVVKRDGARSTWLDAAGALLMLERRDPGEPDLPVGAMELVAFELPEGPCDALRARLNAAAVTIEARTGSTVYVRDPDGRRVGLSAYPAPLPRSLE